MPHHQQMPHAKIVLKFLRFLDGLGALSWRDSWALAAYLANLGWWPKLLELSSQVKSPFSHKPNHVPRSVLVEFILTTVSNAFCTYIPSYACPAILSNYLKNLPEPYKREYRIHMFTLCRACSHTLDFVIVNSICFNHHLFVRPFKCNSHSIGGMSTTNRKVKLRHAIEAD